jgi:hypothetical protein
VLSVLLAVSAVFGRQSRQGGEDFCNVGRTNHRDCLIVVRDEFLNLSAPFELLAFFEWISLFVFVPGDSRFVEIRFVTTAAQPFSECQSLVSASQPIHAHCQVLWGEYSPSGLLLFEFPLVFSFPFFAPAIFFGLLPPPLVLC